jgi:hypothetical protein
LSMTPPNHPFGWRGILQTNMEHRWQHLPLAWEKNHDNLRLAFFVCR